MLKIKEKIYNEIKQVYEYQLNTAKYGYYRFMGATKANDLLKKVQEDNPTYKVCTACGNGVLKMLKDINNAEVIKEAQVAETEQVMPKPAKKNKKVTKQE